MISFDRWFGGLTTELRTIPSAMITVATPARTTRTPWCSFGGRLLGPFSTGAGIGLSACDPTL
jgi:hypothetical protein